MKDTRIVTFTPNIAGFASQYSANDVIGSVTEITDFVSSDHGYSNIISLVVLDKANQKAAIDLIFFDQSPAASIGADNAAYALADADLSKVTGRVTIVAGDYESSSNNAEATIKNIQLLLQAKTRSKSMFVAAVTRGTPTYVSASDLTFKIGLELIG